METRHDSPRWVSALQQVAIAFVISSVRSGCVSCRCLFLLLQPLDGTVVPDPAQQGAVPSWPGGSFPSRRAGLQEPEVPRPPLPLPPPPPLSTTSAVLVATGAAAEEAAVARTVVEAARHEAAQARSVERRDGPGGPGSGGKVQYPPPLPPCALEACPGPPGLPASPGAARLPGQPVLPAASRRAAARDTAGGGDPLAGRGSQRSRGAPERRVLPCRLARPLS